MIDHKELSMLCKTNSIRSLSKITNTRVEYGFQFVYFDGDPKPIQYRHGKEILAKRYLHIGETGNPS